MKEIKTEAELNLYGISSHILQRLNQSINAVMALSDAPGISPVFLNRSASNLQRANEVLDRHRQARGASVCYLLDIKGITIASSNRENPESFVGKSFSLSPFFQKALVGEIGLTFAVGEISRERGLYFSYPVRDSEGRIVGVTVIKELIQDLEGDLEWHKNAFYISPQGVIFLSGRRELKLMSFWPLKAEKERQLLRSRQFGNQPFISILLKEPRDGDIIFFKGGEFLVSRQSVGDEGWSLIMLSALERINNFRLLGIIITLSLSLLLLGGLVGLRRSAESTVFMAVSEGRFREIFENSPEAIFIHDSKTKRILSTNPMMTQWLGYPAEELIQMKPDDFLDPEKKEGLERKFRKKDGTWVDGLITERRFPFQKQEAVLTIARDISELKTIRSHAGTFFFYGRPDRYRQSPSF